MHINNIVKNYLYDNNEFLLWDERQLYVYGINHIILITDTLIKLDLINNQLQITGNNLKVIKTNEKELILQGEINDIKK